MINVNEREILEAALLGYQSQVSDLQNKMREIEARLNPEPETDPVMLPSTRHHLQRLPKPRRRFSAESRAKMAASQKRRWKLAKRAA